MNRRLILFALLAVAVGIFAAFGFRVKQVPPPPDRYAPLVALVLDDFGYTRKNLDALKDVDAPLTVAVLPDTPYSKAVCSFADENGLEVILHLPMEPEMETHHLEKDTIGSGMDDAAVKKIIANAFRSVPTASGMSNHMGSKATKDDRLMTVVLGDLKDRGMFFLDSFTTKRSVCEQAARKVGIPYLRRDVFIDNRLEGEYIKRQMEKLEQTAFTDGSAVGIGHDRGVTIDVLREVVPKMKEKGIKFVYLSEMVEERME